MHGFLLHISDSAGLQQVFGRFAKRGLEEYLEKHRIVCIPHYYESIINV